MFLLQKQYIVVNLKIMHQCFLKGTRFEMQVYWKLRVLGFRFNKASLGWLSYPGNMVCETNLLPHFK